LEIKKEIKDELKKVEKKILAQNKRVPPGQKI